MPQVNYSMLNKYSMSPILLPSFYELTSWAIKGLHPSSQQGHRPWPRTGDGCIPDSHWEEDLEILTEAEKRKRVLRVGWAAPCLPLGCPLQPWDLWGEDSLQHVDLDGAVRNVQVHVQRSVRLQRKSTHFVQGPPPSGPSRLLSLGTIVTQSALCKGLMLDETAKEWNRSG